MPRVDYVRRQLNGNKAVDEAQDGVWIEDMINISNPIPIEILKAADKKISLKAICIGSAEIFTIWPLIIDIPNSPNVKNASQDALVEIFIVLSI
ncbi:hypothetical protein EV177_008600 [Coemansia sp. RSA 1804]|nr:hypothetical protein EV177_008600 [Coemansia sp. RSA 1804]